ncbi:hypothetical protein [Nocardioides sp. SLBN-35]|uniref:hypothetical protein n=1 Tax=Nocardioides sp. SLBN-35 TaxID=2768445 RepID=UPI001173426B|nr:hypothetical protein [Nocardioides sp. SLBN-35]TQK70755.1 hypothetical protein FBY23_2536 [Nocardioides sp. SLBN-35]
MPGSLRAGRAAVCDAMAAGFAGPLRGSTAVDTRVSLRFLGADAVIARSEAGILLAGETGRPLPSGLVPETDPRSPFEMGEVPWLQPLPDVRVPGVDPVVSVNSALLRARASMAKADPDRTREPDAADVIMEMPPMTNWFTGPESYGVFMDWVFAANGTHWRTVPVRANGQAGFAAYVLRDGHGLQRRAGARRLRPAAAAPRPRWRNRPAPTQR